MNHTEQISELAIALIEAQKKFKPAVKDSTNPAFRSKYVDLAGVLEAVMDALTANGLALIQGATATPEAGSISVTTRLLHKSGQWLEETLTLPAVGRDGPTAQSFGSGITYARRYGAMALLGIAPEDDDANSASAPLPAQTADKTLTAKRDEWAKKIAGAKSPGDFNALLVAARSEAPEIRKMLLDGAENKGLTFDKATSKFEVTA